MMMTSRAFMVRFRSSPGAGSGGALGPTEPANGHEDSAQRQPGGPDVTLVDQNEPSEGPHRGQNQGGNNDQRRDEGVHDDSGGVLHRRHGAIANQRDRSHDHIRGASGPVAHRVLPGRSPGRAAYMHAAPGAEGGSRSADNLAEKDFAIG